jgi:hypothetical protein
MPLPPNIPRSLGDPERAETMPMVHPELYRRQPLGLPRGSVRSVLVIFIFGIIWALLLLPADRAVPIPLYMFYLVFLILGSYFASQSHHVHLGHAGEQPPLHLPRGTVRVLILLASIGVVAYGLYQSGEDFLPRLQPDLTQMKSEPFLPLVIGGAFFAGHILAWITRTLLGRNGEVPAWVQDVQSWLALLAVLGMVVELLRLTVISPTLDPARPGEMPTWEAILAGIVAFYFGARS